jgi:hypothetical protein
VAAKKFDNSLPSRPELDKLKAELARRDISPAIMARVEGMFEQWAADPRLIVDRKISMLMNNHGLTYQTRLENDGVLNPVHVDGGRVHITVDSIYRRLILKMVESYEPVGKLKKLRRAPANMLKVRAGIVDETRKRARERTALEAKRKRDRERAKAAAASSTKRAKKSPSFPQLQPNSRSLSQPQGAFGCGLAIALTR